MTGREKFTDLFEAIRHARHHIHLEYFNFRNDSIANSLFDLLAEKVKEGVEVRAMFDAFGNWSNNQPLKKHHLQAIKARGIEIVKFAADWIGRSIIAPDEILLGIIVALIGAPYFLYILAKTKA